MVQKGVVARKVVMHSSLTNWMETLQVMYSEHVANFMEKEWNPLWMIIFGVVLNPKNQNPGTGMFTYGQLGFVEYCFAISSYSQ